MYCSRKVAVSLNRNGIFKTIWPRELPSCPGARILCRHRWGPGIQQRSPKVHGAAKKEKKVCPLWFNDKNDLEHKFQLLMYRHRNKIVRRNTNNPRYAEDTTLTAESGKELMSLLTTGKEERKKAGLKLNIQKAKITASGPITSWVIDGQKWKQWQVLFSWAPKSLCMVTTVMKLKEACSLEEKLWHT